MAKEERQTTVQGGADALLEHNLRFYNRGCSVPDDALKRIAAGRLKGMSDVNPMWRMKRMTEIFGPCGIGWKYTIDRQWVETYGEEVKCFCNVSLYIRDPETRQWSDAIPGSGGSAIVAKETKGCYVNDEGYKMALTDALSIAMKPLGIGGNIWYGPKMAGHNESKYEQYTQYAQQYQQPGQAQQGQQPAATAMAYTAMAYTGEQLNAALLDLHNAKTQADYLAVWEKWRKQCPALCASGTDFFKACSDKAKEFRS